MTTWIQQMARRKFLRPLWLAAVASCAWPGVGWAAGAADDRPNVVLIISDDHGFPDYGFMNHPVVATPHLDKLAAESVVYTRGYVTTALCCPSLSTMLTGLYPHQHGHTGNDPIKLGGQPLDRQAWWDRFFRCPQVPALLRDAGYRTMHTGKYWQGDPARSGFTDSMGETGRHGGQALAIGRDTMQPIYDFIGRAQQEKKPFFVWYAPLLPHTPHNPPERLLAKYRAAVPDAGAAKYYAMIEWFDETCGALLGYLDGHGLRENTIVVYLADNGWVQGQGEARGAKRTLWELGVRQPILLRWPARVRPERDDTHLASNIDVAPTILRAAGLPVPDAMPGVNLLDREAVRRRDAIFLEGFTHDMVEAGAPARSLEARGVVAGEWKLLVAHPTDPAATGSGMRLPEPVMLFHVAADPLEKNNVAAQHPDKVEELQAKMAGWWQP